MRRFILLCIVLGTLASCATKQKKSNENKDNVVRVDHAMVVSAREEASRIGVEIMKQGGNAYDAMVATELTLALVYPRAGNILGGGFMVFRDNDGMKGSLDFREKAPMAASKEMYLDSDGNVIPDLSYTGIMAVGVPGTIAGVLEVHEKKGSMDLERILAPIIELAEKGYKVTEKQAAILQRYPEVFERLNGSDFLFSKAYKAGDVIKNQAYADFLDRLGKYKWLEFYGGGLSGQHFLETVEEHGGIITADDLAKYKPVWRKPVETNYDEYTVVSMAPPSSGGMTMGQILKMINPFDLHSYGHNSVKAIHLVTEAERRAYADRNYYLGDPDFVDIPEELLDEGYLRKRLQSFNPMRATASSDVAHGAIHSFQESNETTHYSIVDPYGNAVAVTTTLNGYYGSKVFCDKLGVFMNNEMDDFSAKPGIPNAYGLIGAEANSIAGEKRMLSSMTPTIVEKGGALYMVLGSPGGSTIITSVLQTFLNVVEHGMNMQEAVNAPRIHHQWLPDEIVVEPGGLSATTMDSLRRLGHKVEEKNSRILGLVDAIRVLSNGKLEGGADRRGHDAAVGY